MKRLSILALLLAAVFAISQTGAEAVSPSFADVFAKGADAKPTTGVYNFDKAHSFIGFKVRHSGLIDVPGFFRDFTGTINYNAEDVTRSTVEFTAKATSVDTGVAPRDNHLRTKDFFEVDKYPDITFKSTKVVKKGKGWIITGDFTMKGVTKSITFPFNIAGFLANDKGPGGKIGVTAQTVINRRDYGINYGNTLPNGIQALSDNVSIDLQIEAATPRPQMGSGQPSPSKPHN